VQEYEAEDEVVQEHEAEDEMVHEEGAEEKGVHEGHTSSRTAAAPAAQAALK
jgi:hypothetical protein